MDNQSIKNIFIKHGFEYNLPYFDGDVSVINFYSEDVMKNDNYIRLNFKPISYPTYYIYRNNIIIATDYFNYYLSSFGRTISFEYLLSIYNDILQFDNNIYNNRFSYKYAIKYMFENKLWLRTNSKSTMRPIFIGITGKRKSDIADAILQIAGIKSDCINSDFINTNYKYYDHKEKDLNPNARQGYIGKYEPTIFCCTQNQEYIPLINPEEKVDLRFSCTSNLDNTDLNFKKLMIDKIEIIEPSMSINFPGLDYRGATILYKILCSLVNKNPVFCTYKLYNVGNVNSNKFRDVLIIGYKLLQLKPDYPFCLLWKVRTPFIGDHNEVEDQQINLKQPISYIISDVTFIKANKNTPKDRSFLTEKIQQYLIAKNDFPVLKNVEAFDLIEIKSIKDRSNIDPNFIKSGCNFITSLKFE